MLTWLRNNQPTRQGQIDNHVANAMWAIGALILSGLGGWISAPTSAREWVFLSLHILVALSVTWFLVAFGRFLWLRSHGGGAPASERQPSGAERPQTQPLLAKISWRHGFGVSSDADEWQLKIRVEFLRHAKDATCYARWARLSHYLSGNSTWTWSRQTTLLPAQPVHEGKVDEFVIATIPRKAPANRFMDLFGDNITGHSNMEETICIEVVVAADTTQREKRYYGLASADRLVPVWINKSRLEAIT